MQLMLMILGLFWGSGKNCFESLGKPLQLMLMMLAPF